MQDESVGVSQLPAAISVVSRARTADTADLFLSRRAQRTSTNQKENNYKSVCGGGYLSTVSAAVVGRRRGRCFVAGVTGVSVFGV